MKTFCFIIFSLFAQAIFSDNYPAPSFDSPRSTMNYFLKTMKGYKKGDQKGLVLASQVFDVSEFDQEIQEDIAKRSSIYLINSLDRIERVDVQTIPKQTSSPKWTYKNEVILTDSGYQKIEIALFKSKDGRWLFTPQTVESIPFYEKYLKNKKFVLSGTSNTIGLGYLNS